MIFLANVTLPTAARSIGLIVCLFVSFASSQNCWGVTVGFKPLTELTSTTYRGYQGGLYPGGRNDRPLKHDTCGRSLARQITPLTTSGVPDPTGKIVLLSIGMSNTTQEFSAFKVIADSDPRKNPSLVIVDGAQDGETASLIADPAEDFWETVDKRIHSAGCSYKQVQVVWLKEADSYPTQPFPAHAIALQSELEAIARLMRSKYPNLKIVYVSSRTYAGYAASALNPEPYAYESGFSVKWMIEKQINGDSSLAFAGANPKAPWLAWGPYLWADGTTPRLDGFTWQCSDTQSDGTHPSPSGQAKVAGLLLDFFKSDPTALPWFVNTTVADAAGIIGSVPTQYSLMQNYPNPFNPTTTIGYRLATTAMIRLSVVDVLGREIALLVEGIGQAGEHSAVWDASSMPSGMYVCRLLVTPLGFSTQLQVIDSRKMMLLR